MRFADPQVCPDCRGALAGEPTCPQCGLDLTSPAVRRLWQLLIEADQLLATAVQARDARVAEQVAARSPEPERPPVSVPVPGPERPVADDEDTASAPSEQPPAWNPAAYPAPPVTGAPRQRRRVSTGAVLLGLGALGMIVAAFIFLTVSWGSLGVAGRALVLLVITGLMGGAASWATRRPLRASAEALWTIFLAMATLDWFVAVDQGLLGLDGLDARPSAIVWSIGAVLVGATIVQRGRPSLKTELQAPMVVSALAVGIGSTALAFELRSLGASSFWSAVAAMLVSASAAAALLRLRQRVSGFAAGAFAVVCGLLAVLLALIEVVTHPSARELTIDGHGVPLVIVVAAVVAVGALVDRTTVVASCLAGAGTLVLLCAPAEEAAPGRGVVVTLSAAVLLGGILLAGAGPWRRGARALVALLAAGLSLLALGWAADALGAAAEGAGVMRSAALDAGPSDVAERWWLAMVLALALTGVLLAACRWPETMSARRHLLPSAAVVGAGGTVTTVAAAEPAYVVTAAVMMGVAVLLAPVLERFATPWQALPPLGVVAAMGAGLTHDVGSVAFWAVGGLVLAAMSTRIADRALRDVVVLGSAASMVGVVSFVLDLAGATAETSAVTFVLTAAVLSAVALLLPDRRGVPVEAVAAVTVLAGLGIATDGSDAVPRAATWMLTSVLALLLSLAAGRARSGWSTAARSATYRAVGLGATVGAMLVSCPDTVVALVTWSVATVLITGLAWRAPQWRERQLTSFLAPLAGAGALGFGLDGVDALPQTFAIAFVVTAAALVLVATVVRGGRDLPVEAAAGVVLAVGLIWTFEISDVLWRAVAWAVAALAVLAVSLLPRTWPGLDRPLALRVTGMTALVVSMAIPLPDPGRSIGFWVCGVLVLAAVSAFTRVETEQVVTALAASLATTGAVLLGLDLAAAGGETTSLALVVTAAVLSLVGALERGRRRRPIELSAVLTAVLGVSVASSVTEVAWQAVVWTVLGALTLLVSLVRPDRTGARQLAYRLVGSGSMAVAYVLRLVASDVGVVEAYTLPFGIALLGAGWWTMRRDVGRSSLVALGPGLTLTLLPSLPQAIDDPTGLRALLLGLGALATLAVGIRKSWQAPFVGGAVVATVLVVVNVGPYANAAPRVVLIAVVSAILLGVGITWEDRVRDGRRLAAYVRSMR